VVAVIIGVTDIAERAEAVGVAREDLAVPDLVGVLERTSVGGAANNPR